jgi:hypothetical protein
MTVDSYNSDVCRAEQLRALRLAKCVIPVRVQPEADIPLYFEPKNWRDFPAQIPQLLADIIARSGATLKPEYRRTKYRTEPLQVPHYVPRPEAIRAVRETLISEKGSREVLAAAGEGATLAGQAEPHRECSLAVSGDRVAW